MRHRNIEVDVKTELQDLVRDKSAGKPVYCAGGIRCREGMSYTEAFTRNLGTCSGMLREKFKQRTCENESTDARHRDRLICSSDEAPVTGVERRDQLFQANEFEQLTNN